MTNLSLLETFNSKLETYDIITQTLLDEIKQYYIGRRVCAMPYSRQEHRDAIINDVSIEGGKVLFYVDWFKKHGSGQFHDSLPGWYRSPIDKSRISYISNQP